MNSTDGVEDTPDATAIVRGLIDVGRTVATAESLTGGLLAATLTQVPGSSAVVRGGLIVYATDLKHSLAGVDARMLELRGPVDPLIAIELAKGARAKCGADFGIGLTGVAGPDPQDGKAVGTVYVALAGPEGEASLSTEPGPNDGLTGSTDRERIRLLAVRMALNLLETELENLREHQQNPGR